MKVERVSNMMTVVDVHACQEPTSMFKIINEARLSIRMIAGMTSKIKRPLGKIFHENLNVKIVWAKVVLTKKKSASQLVRTVWNKLKRPHVFWKEWSHATSLGSSSLILRQNGRQCTGHRRRRQGRRKFDKASPRAMPCWLLSLALRVCLWRIRFQLEWKCTNTTTNRF